MDKVKLALTVIRKHHFWVLCGAVIVVGLAIWTSAAADLGGRFKQRKQTLEQTRDQVLGIIKEGKHPNEGSVAATVQEHEILKENVFRAWRILYDDQKQKNKLPGELTEDFRLVWNSLGPDDEIPEQFREEYMNFIANHFPALFEIIDIRLPVQVDERGQIKQDENGRAMKVNPFQIAETGREGMATRGARDVDLAGKVYWKAEDLKRVRADFTWMTRPETFQVRLAQEDLWVYEALLRIIKNTNEGATNHRNVAVKSVEALQIGQMASAAFQKATSRIFRGMGAGAAGVGRGPGGQPMGGQPMGGPGMEGGYAEPGYGEMGMGEAGMSPGGMGQPGTPAPGAPGGTAGVTQQLLMRLMEGRYVNKKGEPLTAATATSDPPFAEFKMMPIRMLLIIDQTRISDLLVHCANSSMPIEVHRVSINPGQGQQVDLLKLMAAARPSERSTPSGMGAGYPGGYPGAGYGGGEGMGMGYGPGEGGQFGPGRPGSGDKGPVFGDYAIPVEVEGIIYIFNPPDRAKLGTGTGEESTGIAPAPGPAGPGTPPVEPPVPTPTTPAAPPTGAGPPAGGPPGTGPAVPPAPPAGGPAPGPATPVPGGEATPAGPGPAAGRPTPANG